MSDDDHEWPTQYSDETRQRVEETGRALAEAILRHSALAAAATGLADDKSIFASDKELGAAALAFGRAHSDHCGSYPRLNPFEWTDGWDEDEELAVGEGLVTGQGLTVVRRVDFIADDVEALIEAGRVAYLEDWPDHPRRDAEAFVESVGTAIYQINDARGFDALLDTDGLTPTAGMTVIHSQENPLDVVALDAAVETLETAGPWPIFSSEGEVLNSSSEVW